jgi:His/Glu/Gln/Arg/opine family amino acid ABC transporter permease subunit
MHAIEQTIHAFFSPHSYTLAIPDVWAGFQLNLQMMVIAEGLVLVLALGMALVRGLPGPAAKPLRVLAIAYTDFFRGTPIIVVAFIVGFGIPGLQIHWLSSRSVVTYGVITLTLVYTAYVSVIGVAEAASLAQQFSNRNGDFPSYVVAAVFFILITIPLARFTDHLVHEREIKERAQAF